ncbi:MAG TPA: class I SAM-dependent methyltransferase [Patescibacteria group bacterium]|nr:class I SAM-dependent methyltransferase [Patescibacteria group bacterium]
MNQNIADYDKAGYDYEKYWQDEKVARGYENRIESSTIRKFLPKETTDGWFCDLGGGFGRLYDVYKNSYTNTIIADYSLDSLKKAHNRIMNHELGIMDKGNPNPNVFFIAMNAYHTPFKSDVLDYLLSIRMMHHMEDVPSVISEISRVLKPKGKLLLEFANKKHFFEVIRALFGRSKMKPFSLEPSQRGDLFYGFHPKFMRNEVKNKELQINKEVSVSNLRSTLVKKILPVPIMVGIDKLFQPIFSLLKFGPSIYIFAEKHPNIPEVIPTELTIQDILKCPKCGCQNLIFLKPEVRCKECEKTYPIVDGVYDFRVE